MEGVQRVLGAGCWVLGAGCWRLTGCLDATLKSVEMRAVAPTAAKKSSKRKPTSWLRVKISLW